MSNDKRGSWPVVTFVCQQRQPNRVGARTRSSGQPHADRKRVYQEAEDGDERVEVVLVAFDPGWPERFTVERNRIHDALGSQAHRIEHIGSTSVPALAAKPIIDILVTVDDADNADSFQGRLEQAGYVLRVREPGHRMFRTPARDVHVHVWDDADREADRYLLFRDRLRASAPDRAAYEQLKRTLAARKWSDTTTRTRRARSSRRSSAAPPPRGPRLPAKTSMAAFVTLDPGRRDRSAVRARAQPRRAR